MGNDKTLPLVYIFKIILKTHTLMLIYTHQRNIIYLATVRKKTKYDTIYSGNVF